jgi:uncharacterized protein YggE
MVYRIVAGCLLLSQPLWAQEPTGHTIQVSGTGIVQTAPDVALLDIYLRGEGTTPDAATSALAAKQKAVTGGVLALLGAATELTTGNVTVIEARAAACADARGYGSQPRISAGECAVIGYIATAQSSVRTSNVVKAGTAAGLASRLGASDARLQGYALSNPEAAQSRASAAAIETARQRADTVARGAHVRLGPIVMVRDQASYDAMTSRGGGYAPSAPPPPPAPQVSPAVEIDVKPKPIETRAQVFVTYAIAP